MIKRFRLPHSPLPAKSLVDSMSRHSLDRIHNLCQGPNLPGIQIDQRREDHVNMIGHHDSHLEIKSHSAVVQARIQDELPNLPRKYPAMIGAEGQKMWFFVALKMRKLPSVKSLRHRRCSCGDSRPRLSCGAKLRLVLILGLCCQLNWKIFEKRRRRYPKSGIPFGFLARKASFARPDSRGRLSPHASILCPDSALSFDQGYFCFSSDSQG